MAEKNDQKYNLPKAVIDELRNPVKMKGVWDIIKMFPAILFLIAFYLIADRYIDSREKTEMEKIKKEFLTAAVSDLSSPDPSVRKTATLMAKFVIAGDDDPAEFIEMMYKNETDSVNKKAYLQISVDYLLIRLFEENDDIAAKAENCLKTFWIHERDLIPEITQAGIKNLNDKEGLHRIYSLLDACPEENLAKHQTGITTFIEKAKNIKSDTQKIKKSLMNKANIEK